jgi:PAS domain-containing protein
MSAATAVCDQLEEVPAVPGDHLLSMARIFDASSDPVWVHDLTGRCVYRNPSARTASPGAARQRFELFNAADERLGCVAVGGM